MNLRNLTLIGILTAVLILVFWGTTTTSLGRSLEGGAQASVASHALGQANARAATAYALYEIASGNDPTGSRGQEKGEEEFKKPENQD